MSLKLTLLGVIADMSHGVFVKSLFAMLASLVGFLIGANFLVAFSALMILVVIEFFLRTIADISTCRDLCDGKPIWFPALTMLEKAFFYTAIQLVTYALFVATAHLSQEIIFGPYFYLIEESVISFLALTQLTRVVKLVGEVGFGVPKGLVKLIDAISDK